MRTSLRQPQDRGMMMNGMMIGMCRFDIANYEMTMTYTSGAAQCCKMIPSCNAATSLS
ncbi:MAG: hypothetical protein JO271_19535 [Verrucomicrobia bacterium]|nr:hypothetical protein [Verrucomicrobiota bacterium]